MLSAILTVRSQMCRCAWILPWSVRSTGSRKKVSRSPSSPAGNTRSCTTSSPRLKGLIDAFVAENGCVGYFDGHKYIIGDHTNRKGLFERLDACSIPYDYGDVVVSVNVAYERQLLDVLKQTGDTYDLVQNIDSLMILPHNISKGTGAAWLASRFQIFPDATACIGDAENDLSMRQSCKLLGAVSNAIPEMKSEADFVCQS